LVKLKFTKKLNFYELATFSNSKNLNDSSVLKQALDQEVLIDPKKNFLKDFIEHFKKIKVINSQLYQDIFASFIIDKKFEKTFLEFGATDGIKLSNTYLLENSFGWKGALSEPSPQWHKSLKNNRKESIIISECIWSESKKKLDFFMSDFGELSTLKNFIDNDINSLPDNTNMRKKSGKFIEVETISLNDVIKKFFNGNSPSYISVDTEGSEYEILKTLNFNLYRPKLFTVEHNFTDNEIKIDDLMKSNNYLRVFKDLTAFDAWYISEEIQKEMNI